MKIIKMQIRGGAKGMFLFWGREAYLGFYVGGVHHVPKILVMGQSKGSF